MRDTRRTRLVLGVLLLTGFVLITVDAHGAKPGGQGPLNKARTVAATVFGPVERGASAATHSVGSLFDGWGHSASDEARIKNLQAQVATLKGQVETSAQTKGEAAQLAALQQATALGGLRTVSAQLVALSPTQDGSWTATLDAGSRQGVAADQTVLTGAGLVGRIASVGPTTSTVLLAIDPDSVIGVRLAGSGPIGTAVGQDARTLRVEFFDPQLKLTVGRPVLTLGTADASTSVPGVPVGKITKVLATPGQLTRTVLVTTYVDETSVDTVGIVVKPVGADPGDAMLRAGGAH
ncbi:rod shape-determining protein MreC [Actinospica sp.]|jgi:rod shape-determining protein MreC|uniref:rod shape-determining protein MreC n=1 Tax=Actinospica sp. TaxID=1872142 RepID=UPI002CC41D7B|nr:rod shape-determining protein MreC [Actinospica sp.]HWG27961.1 rod shape-determining protein MreC [Actinospica sp.]